MQTSKKTSFSAKRIATATASMLRDLVCDDGDVMFDKELTADDLDPVLAHELAVDMRKSLARLDAYAGRLAVAQGGKA
jgi:hypothetical protein